MKKIFFLTIICLPIISFAQLKQIGDTVWVNNTKLIPGDTLKLNNGSAPDQSFVYIFTQPKVLKMKTKYLPKGAPYLIYKGRKDFGMKVMKYFLPVFSAPNDKNVYTISFPQAIEAREIIL